MVVSLLKNFFKPGSEKLLHSLRPIVTEIESLGSHFSKLSDEELYTKTVEFRESGKDLENLLVPAFATVREVASRQLGIKHFPVQLLGGIVLHKGMIAEMKTGEGKTLVATLPAYLNALSSNCVQIVTVNDYLARRDSLWMGKIFKALGMTVGVITNDCSDEARKRAYECDILYATNNELGFDYLRDNMKFAKEDVIQKKRHFAIIDEVDSILIDEARTPLIISGPVEEDIRIYGKVDLLTRNIDDDDIEIEEKSKSVTLTENGIGKVEELLRNHNLIKTDSGMYDLENMSIVHCVDQALKAYKIFSRDRDYIVKDGKVVIIDEFTGRMMESRRFSEGLHQALEAKEKVKVNQENQTLASITFQNFFRMYDKICGMTGTAATEEAEFESIYGLRVVKIPTNLPVLRIDEEDEIYRTEKEKFDAILKLIQDCNKRKQPVLVGTTDIEKSEKLSDLLKKHKLKHSVLNARYHEQEASIIAQSGRPESITIATNMAGRGTDIQLGGNFEHLSTQNVDKDIEDFRKEVAKAREEVKEAGGLYIVGTERHESRRIDNQLRGRSGRQGDPGKSKFFLSLEDDLLRIFGSSRIGGFLQKLGLEEGEAIYHPWITKAIEKAQYKVEARNYEIRKNVIRFDDVMNKQRQTIFSQRTLILDSEGNMDLTHVVKNITKALIESSHQYDSILDKKTLEAEVLRLYGRETDLSKADGPAEVGKLIESVALEELTAKEKELGEDLAREIKKRIMLITLDQVWREHLYSIDSLKKGINLRAIAQKDPLNEYRVEVFKMFSDMLSRWEQMVIGRLMKIRIEIPKFR